jgi:hypothetical protein
MAVMNFLELFADQERRGFPDLAGSQGEFSFRVSKGLLNELVAHALRRSTAIRELHLKPRDGNQIRVRVTLAKPSFLPPISVEVAIERQATLPDDPVLVLGLSGVGGLLRFAGPAAGFLSAVPPGIRLKGEQVLVDIPAALEGQGLAWILNFVEGIRVTTEKEWLIVWCRARVRG